MDSVRSSIVNVLKLVECTLVDAVMVKIEDCGCENIDDCKLLVESDLCPPLKPIQFRKLLNAWKQSDSDRAVPTADENLVQATVTNNPCMSSAARADTISADACLAAGDNWINSFQIPWRKCSDTMMSILDKGEPVPARDLRLLVSDTMSDIFAHTRRPSRDQLRSVARKIVSRSPASFADYINGKIISDGVESLMLMLESRKENVNRREPSRTHQYADNEPEHSRRKVTSTSSRYGCVRWDPAVLGSECAQGLESKRLKLCQLFECPDTDPMEVVRLMERTYAYQRKMINDGMPVGELITQWPYLGTSEPLLQHFQILTGINMEVSFRSTLCQKAPLLLEFFTICNKNSKLQNLVTDVRQEMESSGSKKSLYVWILLLTAAYFGEDCKSFLHCYPERHAHIDIDIMSLPTYPFILAMGADVLTCQRFLVSVQRRILTTEFSDFISAFSVMFACYFVFNMAYCSACVATLEYAQRDIAGLNPKGGAKSTAGRKKGVQICPRVLTLLRKLQMVQVKKGSSSDETSSTARVVSVSPTPVQTSSVQSTVEPVSALPPVTAVSSSPTPVQTSASARAASQTQSSRREGQNRKSRKRKIQHTPVNDSSPCGACGYSYGEANDPLIEDDWIICTKCNIYCHESCGAWNGRRKKCFVCHAC